MQQLKKSSINTEKRDAINMRNAEYKKKNALKILKKA